ncbi:PREDICTED: dynein heavy chain 2, axonemal-like [Branchiostoma belcheri]|uniref:Dynein heavy chain 2, axonemal-like n=1 Tax=Branchiostoma belcheri TaxID=7741 RepID=A0A6P5ALE7_BRABE|nr:PREDICTED: dynein heavy chain 2, axonemal-like [Branchiostoma belcheri]
MADEAGDIPEEGANGVTNGDGEPVENGDDKHSSGSPENATNGELVVQNGDMVNGETTDVQVAKPPVDVKKLIKDRVILSALKADMWTEEHDGTIERWFSESPSRLLVVYHDPHSGLNVAYSTPHHPPEELTYFIRPEGVEITAENFHKRVQYGTVKSQYIESLLRLMTGVYAPIFFENKSWPDSILVITPSGIKNDFSAQLHKFLANLTDTRYKMEGHTVLYIPNEGTSIPPEVAAKDKELVSSCYDPLDKADQGGPKFPGCNRDCRQRWSSGRD